MRPTALAATAHVPVAPRCGSGSPCPDTSADAGFASAVALACELDTSTYPKGSAVTDQEMAQINIPRDELHGEWTYTLQPCNRERSLS